jgi:hypothetical protein
MPSTVAAGQKLPIAVARPGAIGRFGVYGAAMASRLTSVLADPGRLAAVRRTGLLDAPAEDAFDRVTRMAARLLDVSIALLPLIEDDRQFFKACVGLPRAVGDRRPIANAARRRRSPAAGGRRWPSISPRA